MDIYYKTFNLEKGISRSASHWKALWIYKDYEGFPNVIIIS
jgi:hypothetical protein